MSGIRHADIARLLQSDNLMKGAFPINLKQLLLLFLYEKLIQGIEDQLLTTSKFSVQNQRRIPSSRKKFVPLAK